MTVTPLLAQLLPPAPGPARPEQGDGPTDLAGLFALLLAGISPEQRTVAPGINPSAPAAPGLAPTPAGGVPPAVPATPSARQPTADFGVIRPAADTLPPLLAQPVTSAAAPANFAPASTSEQPASANPNASFAGPVYAPTEDLPQSASHLSLAEPARAPSQTPGAAAPQPLTGPVASLDTVPTGSASAPRPEMTPIVLTTGTTAPAAPPDLPLQTGGDSAASSPAAPRVRSLATAGGRSTATPPLEARRPHVSMLARTAGSAAAAGDQPAASDQTWLDAGSEAADGAVTPADHALADPARAPATGRAAPPPPVLQIGMQIAKAVPGRIDRLVVQLEPAALGRVEVRLKFHRNDQLSAVIAAERPDTLDALQRDARLLERSLHQAGLRLEGDGLSFSLKREQAHYQAREDSWFKPSAGDGADQPLLPARDQPPAVHWFSSLRALDIRV